MTGRLVLETLGLKYAAERDVKRGRQSSAD